MRALNLLFVAPYPPRHGGTAVSLVQITTALHERGEGPGVARAATRVASHALDRMAAQYDRVFLEIVATA